MYYSSSNRNKTGKYGPTSKLRKIVMNGTGIRLIYLQIIISFIVSKSYPPYILYREIPSEFQKVGYTDTQVVQNTDYDPAVPAYYKLFLTALGLKMEAFLFDKCRIVSDEEIQSMKQRREAELIRRKFKRKRNATEIDDGTTDSKQNNEITNDKLQLQY
ncbi:MAG: hypothetical protein EZS28_010721 [Streblomastix strix]|uniref:Uncharacterized protein n=1 Tax=Streblomastix strix TaxID=222440 RepID=A0A5J4WFK0_9EUKA|nr:MAG: hypothetical protein EZS28_010721 [Streblomastix strix]